MTVTDQDLVVFSLLGGELLMTQLNSLRFLQLVEKTRQSAYKQSLFVLDHKGIVAQFQAEKSQWRKKGCKTNKCVVRSVG